MYSNKCEEMGNFQKTTVYLPSRDRKSRRTITEEIGKGVKTPCKQTNKQTHSKTTGPVDSTG